MNSKGESPKQNMKRAGHSRKLLAFDAVVLCAVDVLILFFYRGIQKLTPADYLIQFLLSGFSVFTCRLLGGVYKSVWRYGGTALYIRQILVDIVALGLYWSLGKLLPIQELNLAQEQFIILLNLMLTVLGRMVYQYLYEYNSRHSQIASILRRLVAVLLGVSIEPTLNSRAQKNSGAVPQSRRINIAIVGAGRVGVMLAEEMINNPSAAYNPCCFIDIDRQKIGRYIYGLPVFDESEETNEALAEFPIQEIVFALPEMDVEHRRELYEHYKKTGCKIKLYDYPTTQDVEPSKRQLHEFDIEELLFRQPLKLTDENTRRYYQGKVVLITGGGGSIGGELCRQIARMGPKRLVILDVYENGAYDIQQELRIAYGAAVDVKVEIASVCDRDEMEKIFARHRPEIVLHAAAHKHVPLMENNVCEAIKNNVFGTLTAVEVAEKYGVGRFIMISTDKAVNPTNVMGATKRMCEMIVLNRTSGMHTSATRFGNVLGSAGSVIPLFKRQIKNGGPVTLTDRRIVRYFMTIPEASQLVLQSGAMARKDELFVLDMGKPVKIVDLAENMIRLCGLEPYRDINIIETGLRPGEKLYEELLVKSETLSKTDNAMIFVERDAELSQEMLADKLDQLRAAIGTRDDETARLALRAVVPTYHDPNEVNAQAEQAAEMQMVEERESVAG